MKWMLQNGQYSHVWHLEDDTFYTGHWGEFFEAHSQDFADFVAKRNGAPKGWHWLRPHRCKIAYSNITDILQSADGDSASRDTNTNTTNIRCIDLAKYQTQWTIMRISQTATSHIMNDVLNESFFGHHEVAVAALAQIYNLTFSDLKLVGNMHPGGWGPWKDKKTLTLDKHDPIKPGKAYHPVKCDAYEHQNRMPELMQQLQFYSNNYSSSYY